MSELGNRARIDALTAQARRTAWSVRSDLDWWTAPPVVPDGASHGAYIDTVSQLFYVERAAHAVMSELVAREADVTVRAFLCTQRDDEERHAQALRAYLERLGDVAPCDPRLGELIAHARAWRGGSWAPIVAFDRLLGGEVMPPLRRRIGHWPCRLLRQINLRVGCDERRHAAFARAHADLALPELTADARHDGAAWIAQAWTAWIAVVTGRAGQRTASLHPDSVELARASARATAELARWGVGAGTAAVALAG